MKIAISSGHGKFIRGAAGPSPWGLDEVDEARRVVEGVASALREVNVDVETFHDNTSHSQNENLNRIVNWHNSKTRDLDISVHFNAYEETQKQMGTECLYVTQEELAGEVSAAVADAGDFIDRGAKERTDLFFLNNTEKPSILIETCFVDSEADCALFRQNFDLICQAIAEAVSGEDIEPGPTPPPKPTPPPEPDTDRPILSQGDDGPYVVSVQETLGLPPDGDFGAITDAGVRGFQRAWPVAGGADGKVGGATWGALDDLDERIADGDNGISRALETKIEEIVSKSPVLGYTWHNRGKATKGYITGMAKTFALALQRLENDDQAAGIMAQADTKNPDKDALSWYMDEFHAGGMDNSKSGTDTLRHLFVMMIGLGMCESSGNHWEGRDMSASNTSSETAEAGLFQASWNLSNCASEIKSLFAEFKADPNGFRPTFTEGLYPNTGNLDNYGSGDGCYYQWLAKYCPAFSALMAGVGMRRLRQHWGPINRMEVEIVPEVDDLLTDVEQATQEDQGEA